MTLLDERPADLAFQWLQLSQKPPGRSSAVRAKTPPRPAGVARRLVSESGLTFLVTFAMYFVGAMLLDFKYHLFAGDAITRTANAFYMLHSRDPHLAAIGFVWNPLSSAADLPLMAFNSLWPALASHDVAGTTMSALAMAGAVYQLHAILREWRIRALPRLVLTFFFAFNPMIVLFGANGMSEALYLFTMIAATRYLLRWLRRGDLGSLAYAATALGFAYLERSEPVAAAAFSSLLVFAVTFTRTAAPRRARVWAAFTDVSILVLPIFTAFVGWAFVSYVITGQPFQQFTSRYGNSALIANAHIQSGHFTGRLLHEVQAVTYMGPLFGVIVVAALAVAVLRRNIQVLAVCTVLGAGLTFTLVSYLNNSIFPWFRYYIMVVPLEVLLVASMFVAAGQVGARVRKGVSSTSTSPAGGGRRWQRRLRVALASLGVVVVSVVLLGPSIPSTAMGMVSPSQPSDVPADFRFLFHHPLSAQNKLFINTYDETQVMVAYFNNQHLPNGDVVVDNALNCIPGVVVNVDNPRAFVIDNDRDFQQILSNPLVFHAHYLLAQVDKPAINILTTLCDNSVLMSIYLRLV